MTKDISDLSILPDEILLEIYQYLLNTHVLYSFYGINKRLNASITGICHHISLIAIAFEPSNYLCRSIIPSIGHHIRSISISDCRSVLQSKIFSQCFADRMSDVFPNLQKIILICFTADQLNRFLDTLHDLPFLDSIEIYDLLTDQPNLFEKIVQTNAHRLQSIKLKTNYFDLPLNACLNIHNLTISIQKLNQLSRLLSLIPNIRQLYVTIDSVNVSRVSFNSVSPLLHLNLFYLRCYNHSWSLAGLRSLIDKMPAVEQVFLQISSHDPLFVDGQHELFQGLPKSLREFHFSLRYFYENVEEIDRESSMKAPFPMVCLIDETIEQAVLHTIPYRFPVYSISYPMAKQMSTAENYQDVQTFHNYEGITLAEALPIIARCQRIKEVDIQLFDNDEQLPALPQQPPALPHFSRLKRICFLHSCREYQSLKMLMNVASNLSELFIAFDNLLPIFDDPETCQLLAKRILHLIILRQTSTAPTPLPEEHVPHLVRIFTRLRHLQIDITNGSTIESMVVAILNAFKEHSQLISVVVEGKTSSEQLKSNARQWLIENTHFTVDGQFDAEFREQTNRFLLWM